MKFNLTPNKPVPLDRVVAGNASDARWRVVGLETTDAVSVDMAEVHRAEVDSHRDWWWTQARATRTAP